MKFLKEDLDQEKYVDEVLNRLYDFIDASNEFEYKLKDWENNNWKYRDEIDMDIDSLVNIAKSYYTNISLTKSKLKDLGINIE